MELDLAVGNLNTAVVSILVGRGDGTFRPAMNSATESETFSIAVGDFNGDGNLDLAVGNHSSGSVSILLGNGTFRAPVNYTVGLFRTV